MQTEKVGKKKPQQLVQGHIFELSETRFPVQKTDKNKHPVLDSDGQSILEDKTFWDFYPFAEFENINYGIIITQSCDLENRKAPYLTVGVLEDIDSNVSELLDRGFFIENFREFQGKQIFCSETLLENLSKKLDDLIQNKTEGNNYHLFFELDKKKRRFFYVNLTKLFPIKGVHYDNILRKVKYQVIGDFQHLIGWKLANLYGRVGVDNYTTEQQSKIISELAPKFIEALQRDLQAQLVDVKTNKVFGEIKSSLATMNNSNSKQEKKDKALAKIVESLKSLDPDQSNA